MGNTVRKMIFCYLSGVLFYSGYATTGLDKSIDVSLVFRDTVLVKDSIIFLRDIADIQTSDALLKSSLQMVLAGSAAPAGYSRFLNTNDFILYRLRSGFKNVRFKRSGSDRILVRTDFIEKRIDDYQLLIRDYFDQKLLWPKECFELSILEPQRSWKCLPDSVLVEVQGLDQHYPKGHVQVFLDVQQGTRRCKIPVSCNVKVTVPVLIATTSIVRGQVISSRECELKMMDITRFAPQPLFNLNSLEGVRAVRSIAPGTIIHNRLIQSVPVIEKGELVDIIVSKGRVRVAVQGVAREAGKEGEKIWVENLNSKKLIQTIIKGKGIVTVAQGGIAI